MTPFPYDITVADIARERRKDIQIVERLQQFKLKGRIRTDRATPTSNSNVIAGDNEGDVLNDGTYLYTIIDVAGIGLRWHRETLAISW